MKNVSLILIVCGLFYITGCQKKKLDVTLVETACQDLRIFNGTYATISDSSCTHPGNFTKLSYNITFSYKGSRECLKKIVINPTFYKSDQKSTITGVNYPGVIFDTSKAVVITTNTVTFPFNIQFASKADAALLAFIYIQLHTENILGDKSKDVLLRINPACGVPPSNVGKPVARDTVSTSTISMKLWDDAAEDGDIVSIAINGQWVLQNYTLKNAGEFFNFPVLPKNNEIVLVAMNQGTSGPNTCALSINGGKQITMHLDLKTGQSVDVYRK